MTVKVNDKKVLTIKQDGKKVDVLLDSIEGCQKLLTLVDEQGKSTTNNFDYAITTNSNNKDRYLIVNKEEYEYVENFLLNKLKTNKVKNEKLYIITADDDGAKFIDSSVKICFAKFLTYELPHRDLPTKLQNLLPCLKELKYNCVKNITKFEIEDVCAIIELLNPMLKKEILDLNSVNNTMTIAEIMKDYILKLINSLPDTMVIDMLNKFVTLDTVDFEVKNNENNSK